MAQLGRFSTPALRKRVCACSVPCACVSQPCHPAATAAAEGLHLSFSQELRKVTLFQFCYHLMLLLSVSNPLITNANAVSQIPMDGSSQMSSSLLGD